MSLSNRIATALTKTMKSGDVDKLLQEVRSSVEATETDLELQRELSLDPTSSDDVVSAARKAIEELQFNAQRMREAEKRLTERLSDLIADERDAEEKARQKALLSRQAAIRAKFAEEYHVLAERITALAAEMTAAGLEKELPDIMLGSGPQRRAGIGFNSRRYWPKPQYVYEYPTEDRSWGYSYAGRIAILPDADEKEKAA